MQCIFDGSMQFLVPHVQLPMLAAVALVFTQAAYLLHTLQSSPGLLQSFVVS
jgi:hypothetical protein